MSLLTDKNEPIKEIQGIKLRYGLINFMKYRIWGYVASSIIILVSLFFIITKGFNWGLDFTGGTVIEMSFSQPANIEQIRSTLSANQITSATVQTSGTVRDVMIRLPASINDPNIGTTVRQMMQQLDSGVNVQSIDFVGPNVGEELTLSAIYATLATLGLLLVYIGSRFEWRLALGAVLSLAHDVIMTLGFFAFFQIEMDLTFVAAILSVVGYSLNDSIVVFDRVRENLRKIRRMEVFDIINISLTQTLSRTLMTSITTLFVVLALFIFGGPTIHSFSFALLIGIGFGTYSSIFIAIALAFDFGLKREHMIVQKASDDELDQEP